VQSDLEPDPAQDSLRSFVFKNRGALLAVPALSLIVFGRPTRRSIAAGVPIAIAGELLRCWAVGYTGTTTRADRVTAPELVTAGPYAHVRNPLYVGNFITAAGLTLAFTGGLSGTKRAVLAALGLGSMLAVYATIVPHEEAFLARAFGDDYADYQARVPALGWRLQPAQFSRGSYDPSVIAQAETKTFATLGAMLAAVVLKAVVR
jgi:protein-S-isoprenylcysteine O-methyltransferase Ste14